MKSQPLFKPHPDGEQYLISFAGVVLICGDTIYGDPAETTPAGRSNAMRMADRALQEAEKRGFKHSSTVWSLMRRNEPNPRLRNLVQEAANLIPKDVQTTILNEEMRNSSAEVSTSPLVTATKHPGQHEPESNPKFLRPGPDGIDPRFWAAGHELERIARMEGKEAIHKPEHAHLYVQMLRFAPKVLREEMDAKAKELGLLPQATHVGEDGQPVFSTQQLADTHGVSVEEVERFIAQSGIDPDDLYTGPVHPLQ